MCYDCWASYGKPIIINGIINRLAKLIDVLYKYHGAGGGLHIIVDDWNLEDSHVEFCEQNIAKEEYIKLCPKTRLNTEKACIKLLKSLSIQERASALALQRGFKQ